MSARMQETTAVPLLELRGVRKSFGADEVLGGIDLTIREGELVAIVGFSGSGKSTLISLLAGLAEPTAGSVLFEGNEIAGPGPDRGVVFQSYSLMPWLTVRANVALAVDAVLRGSSKHERRAVVDRYVEMVGLAHAADRRPAELSGGMRQRVAVARALAMRPKVLLLDEPLSALDALTRAKLQDELAAISERERKTIVLITNDVDEALLLADRIVPLNPGPSATLGPEFRVPFARPRSRAALGDDAELRRLRAAITRYLLDASRAKEIRDATRTAPPNPLPNVTPLAPRGEPPRAYVQAAGKHPARRYVEFFRVSKSYPTRAGTLTVVDGFDLKMERGEFVSLIGHSGCGKSTVLAMAAGLSDVSGGGIVVDGREVHAAGPDRAVVFQAPSLFPWLTAAQNVALGVDRVYPHATAAERGDIVSYYLARVGLASNAAKLASDLSNGMRQRVGLARAFALNPKLLLLDEPFGMLDSLTRWELQELLMEVWARTQVTAICVTHDVDEAILLADRVVMMTNGPNAKVGKVMTVNLPRPRTRKALLEHPDYYAYRQEVLDFLAGCERAKAAAAEAA
ncbi:MAG TPA: nitrate ABC transporter ATP-binding protein [Gammaproteobacteria bacterium]|nr:nitrate ABC transporter ATP-binding protein [Gammaproteobacteria bacterium]